MSAYLNMQSREYADITGVGQVSLNALPLVTCNGTIHMTQGPVVPVMNQYAYYGKGSTVHYVGYFISVWS